MQNQDQTHSLLCNFITSGRWKDSSQYQEPPDDALNYVKLGSTDAQDKPY